MGFGDFHPPRFGAAAERFAENVAQADHADLRVRYAGNLDARHAAGIPHLELDFLFIEFAPAQHLAE